MVCTLLNIAAGACLTLSVPAVDRLAHVRAIQEACERPWEITYNERWGRPAALPPALDRAAAAVLERRYGHTRGKTNLDIVYLERFRAPFRGPVRALDVYLPRSFTPQLGRALAALPQLERLSIFESEDFDTMHPEAVDTLFDTLPKLPNLRRLALGTWWVTDLRVEFLRGAPLRELSLNGAAITDNSLAVFLSMPELRRLDLTDTGIEDEKIRAFSRAAPQVEIVHPAIDRSQPGDPP